VPLREPASQDPAARDPVEHGVGAGDLAVRVEHDVAARRATDHDAVTGERVPPARHFQMGVHARG
jgi:hypothetical protein